MSQEYHVNEFISLKLTSRSTFIYVNEQIFSGCKYLLISIPLESMEDWDHYDSMDEIIAATNRSRGKGMNTEPKAEALTPEEAFIGHCSNLQAWAENGYDYRLLDTRLSIPIIIKIMEGLVKSKEKEKFRRFFHEAVGSIDSYIINSLNNAYTWGKFKFLYRLLFRTKDRYITDEEISGSIALQSLYDKWYERKQIEKAKTKYLRWESKLWGTGRDNLKYRRFLRKIRNHDESTIVSEEMDYLPYLYAKGRFTDGGSISIYLTKDYNMIIRDEKGRYWKKDGY